MSIDGVTLASFPGPTKERRGPGTHCSRVRGLHGNQVAGVIDEAQTELVYLKEYDHLDVRYLELIRFANATIINGESTESVYGICIVY